MEKFVKGKKGKMMVLSPVLRKKFQSVLDRLSCSAVSFWE